MNNTTNIMANHLAIVIETPAISPNPNNAAKSAMIRKVIAKPNKVKPLLFIFYLALDSIYVEAV